jgi:hypothetical protein
MQSPKEKAPEALPVVPTKEYIQKKLAQYDRSPFVEALAAFVAVLPAEDDLRDFAKRNPDKWTNALRHLASLAGFADQVNVVVADLSQLSDSQLMARILAREQMLRETDGGSGIGAGSGKQPNAPASERPPIEDVDFEEIPPQT